MLFVIGGVVIIAWIAEPNAEYPLPELEKRFLRTGQLRCIVCGSVCVSRRQLTVRLCRVCPRCLTTEFVVYIVAVGVCAVSMLATIKGSLANRLKNQVYWSKQRQKQRMKVLETRIQSIERRLLAMEQRLHKSNGKSGRDAANGSPDALKALLAAAVDRSTATSGDDELDDVPVPNRVPYYYAICSGIVGAITVLLAKCSAIMIALSLKGDNQFKYGLTYVFIGGMFVCILVQTHFLNMATALGDIMTVFPIFQACWITFSVIGGAIFYDADRSLSPQELVLYPTALLSIAVGVGLLVQHKAAAEADASGKAGGGASNEFGGLDDDDEICLITDASMHSPLLPPGSRHDDGYLRLDDA